MNKISESSTRDSEFYQIDEKIPSMNNVGAALTMSLSCEATFEFLYCERFRVDATLKGSKWWTLHVFHQMDIGTHRAQVTFMKA